MGAALALDPELALVPEDVPGCEAAQLADAEAGVEEGPDDEPLGGRLAGVGQAVGLVGGERLSHISIRHLPPPKSCVVGVGPRSRCVFRPPSYPRRTGAKGLPPGKTRGDRHPGPSRGRNVRLHLYRRNTHLRMEGQDHLDPISCLLNFWSDFACIRRW